MSSQDGRVAAYRGRAENLPRRGRASLAGQNVEVPVKVVKVPLKVVTKENVAGFSG